MRREPGLDGRPVDSQAHARPFAETTIQPKEVLSPMTRAQQTYERVEALVAEGSSRAEAFKRLADEYGQPLDSIRGAYYTGRRQASGESGSTAPRRTRRRETTEEDAIAGAIASLERSIETIQEEVQIARERSKEARAEHEALSAAAGPRIEKIQAKIAALGDDEVTED
jgi:hypothetical protein